MLMSHDFNMSDVNVSDVNVTWF